MMTYVSKGEQIFALPNCTYTDCTPARAKRSDGRLKTFPSILDDRVWSLDEKKRYRYLYNIVSGSQTCLTEISCFKYVPLEEIIKILCAERDEYIKCLEKKLGIGGTASDTPINELYKANCFENDEDQEAVAMKNKIAALTAELAECKNTRDTMRQAMHKLENIDEIVNENKCLKARLRCSEEMIKLLEEKKKKMEKELENLRSKSEIQIDLDCVQESLKQKEEEMLQKENTAPGEELYRLCKERNALQQKVEELQNELLEARSKQSELELLKKQSECTNLSLEEMTKENECYKKKLSSMKCLERQICELKKQASLLAEKYKRDSAKASDHDKQLKDISKEVESLRDERDRLRKKVDELACYECQYNALQCKLQQLDSIIAENEMLNSKLASLDKLELENELLRCKLEACQLSELEAAESKEKIIELQCAVADQEEEMKDLLSQIERLTRAYGDDELVRLKDELSKKDCKLKLCEEQLAEIPLLEAEIDALRCKLDNCCSNVMRSTKKTENEEDVTMIGTRIEEDVRLQGRSVVCEDIKKEEAVIIEKADACKGSMTCEEAQNLLQSSRGIISCVLEDMIEHQKEMEELEKCNKEMKDEICLLKAKVGKTDMDDCLQQIAELNRTILERDLKICCLEQRLESDGDLGKVNAHICNLESEIEYLKDLNRKMREDLEEACNEVQRCAELECLLEEEKRARAAAEDAGKLAKDTELRKSEELSKLQKEEYNLETKGSPTNEIEYLKCQVEELSNLVAELQKENLLLKEAEQACPDFMKELDEKNALENLLNLLQCELDACRENKLGEDTDALRSEIKKLKGQNCQLKGLINCYKERLDLERNSKDEGCCCKCSKSKNSSSDGLQDENHKLRSEITRLRCDLAATCKTIQEHEKTICDQAIEIEEMKVCIEHLAKINAELEKELCEKEIQQAELKKEVSKLTEEAFRLSSDNDVLQNRLQESEAKISMQEVVENEDYEGDLTDKHEIESTMRSLEGGMDDLQSKLEGKLNEAEMQINDLLQKQNELNAEIEALKKLLAACQEKETEKSEPPPSPPSPAPVASEPSAKENQLLEDMMNMRENMANLQAEVDKEKAENRRLQNELDDLRRLLDECRKQHEEDQIALNNAKREGMAYPVPQPAQTVPETIIPVREEQRVAVIEQSGQTEVIQPQEAPKTAVIEPVQPNLVKVVVDEKKEESPKPAVKPAPREPAVKPEPPAPRKPSVKPEPPPPRVQQTPSDTSSVVSFSDLDPDFQKFLCSLNPANHKQNICAIEKRYRQKMCDLQKKNDEKIKRLVEQFEKETKTRDKSYSDSLNNVRSGYETDIRKLAERHKSSILRLQSLHEDEVQELNINYETQMEAMQTQNENIVNDLTSGATQKFKMLAEQHNRDIKELEQKYQKLLSVKEEEYARRIANLQSGGALDSGELADIQNRHNRELKKLKSSNLKRLDLMKHKFEDLIMCERKKYEKQLEDVIQRLRQGKPIADGICQCRVTASCGPKDPNAPLEFNDVIQKILDEGLESLNFNEVALVHRKTCAATEDIVLKPEMKAQLVPPIKDEPSAPNQLMKANKEELLSRILVLENEIAIKQMETQDEIVNMEIAVKAERKRLQELRESLRSERQKNSELKSRLSKTQMSNDMKAEMDYGSCHVREQDILRKMREIQREISGGQPAETDRDNIKNKKWRDTPVTGENKRVCLDLNKSKSTSKKKRK